MTYVYHGNEQPSSTNSDACCLSGKDVLLHANDSKDNGNSNDDRELETMNGELVGCDSQAVQTSVEDSWMMGMVWSNTDNRCMVIALNPISSCHYFTPHGQTHSWIHILNHSVPATGLFEPAVAGSVFEIRYPSS